MNAAQVPQQIAYQGGAPVAYMPYMSPPPAATPQADPIDQIAKVAKLLDYLQNKNGAGQTGQNTVLQPGQQAQAGQFGNTSQNIAQFQPQSQSMLDAQQRASGMEYQVNAQSQNLDATQRSLQNVAQYAAGLEQELNTAYQVINNLAPFLAMTQVLLRESEQQNAVIESLTPFVVTTLIYQSEIAQMESVIHGLASLAQCLIPMMNESEQAYQVATNLERTLCDPGFLLVWTFELLKQIGLTKFDLNLVSELFLELCALKDPTSFNAQPNYQQVPLPIPGNNANYGKERGVMAILELLKNPQGSQTATALQRMRVAGVI